MPSTARQRVRIANPADGGVVYWAAKLYGFAALVGVAIVTLFGVCTYGHFARMAPPPPNLATYATQAPGVTRMYAADGTLLGEFANEWREVAAYDAMPEHLIQAVLAAEDHRYFEHRGIDVKGILRAAWRNLTAGDFAQGGSTITQQVAKQFLGSEKSLTRKAKEAIVARRLEARYSKHAILSLYLNEIYLGGGAYGVRAAARRYFSKPLAELTIGEAATIAGMAQAPSRYSPLASPERALARRNEVLERMERHGYISADEAAAARAEALELNPHPDVLGTVSPYFSEHVRRYAIDALGAEALLEGGLRIETTVLPAVDAAAYATVDLGARKQDKRQGWRGAVAFLEGKAQDLFRERSSALYGARDLVPGRRYLGLVEQVERRRATVRIGDRSYPLPLANMDWAAPWSREDATNDRRIASVTEALRAGDVVWVKVPVVERGAYRDWFLAGLNPRWRPPREPEPDADADADGGDDGGDDAEPELALEQVPHPQAAILTADHGTGYVLAMVGGNDFARSEYNRAIQACRQPASTYKPIYYSAALDEGYGYETLLNDIPRAEVDPETGEVWVPTNLGGTVENKVTLEYALVFSKNIPSVAIFKKVGAEAVEAWARRLGFTTTIIADKALALGASCTTLDELTRAFAIFARNGRWVDWVYVRRILDRNGNALEDNTVYTDPWLRTGDRLDRLAATAGKRARQAIPARTAYLTSKLLRRAIEHGFSSILRQTGIITAGKTGTSSATMDTLFVAYTARWITTVWMGDDLRVRPLGINDAAYMLVEPMWARYMKEVADAHPAEEIPWQRPEGVPPDDRGGRQGEQAEAPMPLIWKSKSRPAEGEG